MKSADQKRIRALQAVGDSPEQIAKVLDMPLEEVRRVLGKPTAPAAKPPRKQPLPVAPRTNGGCACGACTSHGRSVGGRPFPPGELRVFGEAGGILARINTDTQPIGIGMGPGDGGHKVKW